jgi:hypothetical protein
VIPTTGTKCSAPTNLWTLTELRNLSAELSHVRLTKGNYSPIAVDNPGIQGLLAALLHHVCEHLLILRLQCQSLPSAVPSQYQSQCIQHHLAAQEELTHTPRQRFLDNGDMLGKGLDFSNLTNPHSTKQTPVDFVAPSPKPMVHPAFYRYLPPPDRPPAERHRSPQLAREAHAQQPVVLTEHQLLHDRELYTLISYGDAPDDILIGETTEPGSYHGAFCRRRMQAGDVLGGYTSRRRKDSQSPPITPQNQRHRPKSTPSHSQMETPSSQLNHIGWTIAWKQEWMRLLRMERKTATSKSFIAK